jgi:hypothetical protein
MSGPPITLRCDCGAVARVDFGSRWTCPECGRVYDTSRIPAEEYNRIGSIQTRYRLVGLALITIVALGLLALVIWGYPFQIFIALPGILLGWYLFVKPTMRRRYMQAMASRPEWTLHPEPAPPKD